MGGNAEGQTIARLTRELSFNTPPEKQCLGVLRQTGESI